MAPSRSAKPGFNTSAEAKRVAAKLPALNLEARKLAATIQGQHNKNNPYDGEDFHSFEEFQNGFSSPRQIDWRRSSRNYDHNGDEVLLVRRREQQVSHEIYLFGDDSPSMDYIAPRALFGKDQPRYTKKEVKNILMLAMAHLAANAGEHFTIMGSGRGMMAGKKGIERALEELKRGKTSGPVDLPKLPMHKGKALKPNSQVFIFSDFLPAPPPGIETMDELRELFDQNLDDIRKMIRSLYVGGVKVNLVQILDPSEVEWRYSGHVEFSDLESPVKQTMRKAESVKETAESLIRDHIAEIEDMVKRYEGWSFTTYVTNQPLREALMPALGLKPKRSALNTIKAATADFKPA